MLEPLTSNSTSSYFQAARTISHQPITPIVILALASIPAYIYLAEYRNSILAGAIENNYPILAKLARAGGARLSDREMKKYVNEAFEKKDLAKIKFLCQFDPKLGSWALKEAFEKKDLTKIKFLCQFDPKLKSLALEVSLNEKYYHRQTDRMKPSNLILDVEDSPEKRKSFIDFCKIVVWWIKKEFDCNAVEPFWISYNYASNSRSVTQWALLLQAFEAAEFFIQSGAVLDFEDGGNNTALHYAAAIGKLSILTDLVKRGANINRVNKHFQTPLCDALSARQYQAADYLIDIGAKIESQDPILPDWEQLLPEEKERKESLQKQGITIKTTVRQSTSPMHMAMLPPMRGAKVSSLPTLKKLINKHADINEVTEEMFTPIAFAFLSKKSPKPEIIQYLINQGGVTHDWDPVLHLAVSCGWELSWINLLLDRGADVNCQAREGKTVLHIALSKENHEAADFLLQRGAKLLIKDRLGKIPFDYDLEFARNWIRSINIHRALLVREMGRSEDFTKFEQLQEIDEDGRTLLYWANERKDYDIIKSLENLGLTSSRAY